MFEQELLVYVEVNEAKLIELGQVVSHLNRQLPLNQVEVGLFGIHSIFRAEDTWLQ